MVAEKCDEHQPCRNCIRRREYCSLEIRSPQPQSSLPFLVRMSRIVALPAEEWAMELFLMHHYSNEVAYSFSDDPLLRHMWKDEVPTQALYHPFLMHAVISVSALHLIHVSPNANPSYMQLVQKHNKIALSTLHALLLNITKDNCDAVFLCSSLTSIASFYEFSLSSDLMSDKKEICEKIAELCNVIRGVRTVSVAAQDWIENGPLRPISNAHAIARTERYDMPEDINLKLQELKSFVLEDQRKTKQRLALEEAMEKLEELYTDILFGLENFKIESGSFIKYLTFLSPYFIGMLRDADANALLLFAYFSALSAKVPAKWYCNKRFGRISIKLVQQVLDAKLHSWLEWPKQYMG
jgi:hypothetical protein